MLDINGRTLAVDQTVLVACKDSSVANVPILKKGIIEDLNEGTNPYIKVRYKESGKLATIDGYMFMSDKRFCIL